MLRALRMKDVGPASTLELELGERLNVLTGDNGLGKSFVLEVAFWALTGEWTGRPVLPQVGKEESATLAMERQGLGASTSRFDRLAQKWEWPFGDHQSAIANGNYVYDPEYLKHLVPVLYMRPDGLFSLWDPVRVAAAPAVGARAQHFTERDLWYGKGVCNGLIRDWVTWQLKSASGEAFSYSLLCRVLGHLSHPDEPMKPGRWRRLYLDDALDYPTIELPYETIPVVHASAGMKRVLSLAYILTWMWTEHVQAAQLTGREPADRFIVLMEEPETHLHPKWQRHIVRALLDVLTGLAEGSPTIRPQVILTTHAPLVLSSLEPYFDRAQDKLFSFDLRENKVVLDEMPWVRHGDALAWLTSEIFGLSRGLSPEADAAIEAAYDFMAHKPEKLPKGLDTADTITTELTRLLPDNHPVLLDWIYHMRQQAGS